ncbi:MAG: delta-60 repeat domain-containing protein [Flavobacteriales bacterium]|nr:delta-60 repeat domain-containing protein [Flavobacteriales bacterium]
MLIGGSFTLTMARWGGVARLNADGTLDTDFGPTGEGCGNSLRRSWCSPMNASSLPDSRSAMMG